MKEYKLFINNQWVPSSNGQTFTSTCSANGEVLASFHSATKEDVDRACRAARAAFESGVWSRMENNERAKIMLLSLIHF